MSVGTVDVSQVDWIVQTVCVMGGINTCAYICGSKQESNLPSTYRLGDDLCIAYQDYWGVCVPEWWFDKMCHQGFFCGNECNLTL